jgi:hypothetical protein
MDDVEGEEVVRQGNRNREWTRMDANLNCGQTARISEHSRLFAFIRGWMLDFLIFQDQLMQVVDFHDIFTYFLYALWARLAQRRDAAGPHPPPTCEEDGERQSGPKIVRCARLVLLD